MANQASKRIRRINKRSAYEHPTNVSIRFDEIETRRKISQELCGESSARALRLANHRLRPRSSRRRLGSLALDIVRSGEMCAAFSLSPLSGFASARKLMADLEKEIPKELLRGREVATAGFGQFEDWVGVALVYPEFDKARNEMITVINRVTHTDHKWEKMEACIRLFEGDLSQLDTWRIVLPPIVNLKPALLEKVV